MKRENLVSHLKKSTLIALVAVVANNGFVAFARRTAEISTEFEPLTYSAVSVSVVISAYAAYGIFELLKVYTQRPYEIFMYVSGFVLVISYMPIGHAAVGLPNAGMAEINVLGTLHALTAVVILTGLAKMELMEKSG